jgi:AcrR family transcriptional regulator
MVTPTSRRRPPGPRPKISRADIAEAVLAIGLDNANMKDVAEYLQVSVAGLYHHVRGREDLLRVGGEHLVSRGELPAHRGLSWREWLHKLAWFWRTQLAMHPVTVTRYISGSSMFQNSVGHVETALETLGEFGFAPLDAYMAIQVVGEFALGAALDDLREEALVKEERPWLAQMHSALAKDPAGLVRLRELLVDLATEGTDLFERKLALILDGIAASRVADAGSTGQETG